MIVFRRDCYCWHCIIRNQMKIQFKKFQMILLWDLLDVQTVEMVYLYTILISKIHFFLTKSINIQFFLKRINTVGNGENGN